MERRESEGRRGRRRERENKEREKKEKEGERGRVALHFLHLFNVIPVPHLRRGTGGEGIWGEKRVRIGRRVR